MQETQSYQRFQRIGHTDFNTSGTNGPRGEIGAFSPSATAVLCVASETHFISPCFYIHTFPGSLCPPLYQIRQSCRHNAVPNHFLSRFSTYLTNAPRSLSRVKAGTHSPSPTESHTAAYTPKQGLFRMGALSLLSERFTRFGNPAWPGVRTANFAAFGILTGRCSRRTQKAFGTAMRLCAPLFRRRRGPAGLRDLFRFCQNCGFHALRSGPFRVCEAGGGITTLSALYVLLKRRTAAC